MDTLLHKVKVLEEANAISEQGLAQAKRMSEEVVEELEGEVIEKETVINGLKNAIRRAEEREGEWRGRVNELSTEVSKVRGEKEGVDGDMRRVRAELDKVKERYAKLNAMLTVEKEGGKRKGDEVVKWRNECELLRLAMKELEVEKEHAERLTVQMKRRMEGKEGGGKGAVPQSPVPLMKANALRFSVMGGGGVDAAVDKENVNAQLGGAGKR